MAEPFLGEIRLMAFGFPPKGWSLCNGGLLPINQNSALFSLFGTMYGGDGRTNFALPNLQSRTPIHRGNGFTQGQTGGEEAHTLSMGEMPQHTHTAQGSSAPGNSQDGANNVLGVVPGRLYNDISNGPTTLHPTTISNAGGGQPHTNMQPFLVLNFCVALQGIFPSQN